MNAALEQAKERFAKTALGCRCGGNEKPAGFISGGQFFS
jgi:hypothetical protein